MLCQAVHALLLTRLNALERKQVFSHDKAGDICLHQLPLNAPAHRLIVKALCGKEDAVKPLLCRERIDIFQSVNVAVLLEINMRIIDAGVYENIVGKCFCSIEKALQHFIVQRIAECRQNDAQTLAQEYPPFLSHLWF